MQDSKSDWTAESSHTADVYIHASLTIAASSCPDNHVGFLHKRDRRQTENLEQPHGAETDISPYSYLNSPLVKGEKRRSIYLESPLSDSSYSLNRLISSNHFSSHLGRRAWTLQERIMSSRTIFFYSEQLFWECRSTRFFEGWINYITSLMGYSNDFQTVGKLQCSLSPISSQPPGIEYNRWYSMLEEFTTRDLTYHTDKIPALPGLAREFTLLTGDTYLVGL